MQTVIIAIHLMIVAALIGAVLLQRSEGGGLGIGGGGGFMSSRGTANLLTRTTAILAVGFFITSLFLSWLASYDRKPSSILGTSPAPISAPNGATPVAPSGGGLLDQLQQQDKAAPPAAPAPPRSQ
jgi:preprotein translocase subunit SecG